MPNPHHQKNIVHGNITAGGDVRIGDDYITYHNYFAAQEVKIPHRLTNNIPTNADYILGRTIELERTKEYLAQNRATVLFNGIGGIGKTTLASKFMALNGSEYKHLAWITVQSTLAEAFSNNAPLLASLQITEQVQNYIEARQFDKAFEYLFHQLNLLERTLVVIDNANDLDDLGQYKNWFDTANCHFLITSRSQPAEWATIEVDSLPEDEAVALFRKLHPSEPASNEAVKKLLSKLFYHTLLIELVAKAGATTGIAFTDLQTMIETQFIHHQSLNEAPIPTGKHGSVVATNLKKAKIEDYIWLIFSQVKGLNEGPKQLLKAMALLPVASPFDLDFLKAHFTFFNISNAIVHLDTLTEWGWLQKEQGERQKPYFKMHPLIADVTVENLDINPEYAKKYIGYISKSILYDGKDNSHEILQINKSRAFAERLIELFFYEDSELISGLLYDLSWLYNNFGEYSNARNLCDRAVQILENNHQVNEFLYSKYQSLLAIIYRNLGDYGNSAKLLESSLEKNKKTFDEDHIHIIVNLSLLAGVYSELGRHEEAIVLAEKAYFSEQKKCDDNHPSLAIRRSKLGLIYKAAGRTNEAMHLMEKSLDSAIINFGENHPTVSIRQAFLGEIYRLLGDNDKAFEILNKAMEKDLRNFGSSYFNVTFCQWNLGLLYLEIGCKNEAISFLSSALNSYAKTLGDNHPKVLSIENALSVLRKR